MTGKLTDEYMDQLESWIGAGPKTFTLLYSITRDGCDATTFHQKCDNQEPTVTVLYNQQGSVYGGYTCTIWNSSGYIKDDKAFLYQLLFSGTKQYNRFPCTKSPGHAIYATPTYGPTFGGGHDLKTFNDTVNSSGGYFALNGYNKFGHSYDTRGATAENINNGNMNVTELEVYKVTDGQRLKMVEKPWRKTPDLNGKYLAKLVEEIENIKPLSDVDITEFRILMLGPIGSGKSSFYNTIDSIFRGRISHRAMCGNDKYSTTTAYTPYGIRTKSGSKLNVRLCDTRGMDETLGPEVMELNFLVDGHIPDFYEFNPTTQITVRSTEFVMKPEPRNLPHCVVIVIDASKVDTIPPKVIDKIKGLRKLLNQRKLPLAIVLTKIDKVNKEVGENATKVFFSKDIEELVEKVAMLFGVPDNLVFPVKNYSKEIHLNDGVSTLALTALQQLLYLAEDYTENLLMTADGATGGQARQVSEQEITESDTA